MRTIAAAILTIWASMCAAQTEATVINPLKVDTPPRIDGRLDDPVWASIEPISDFRQQEPDEGHPLSERTEVRICYDRSYLYLGVRAFDREPERILANDFERDAGMANDDYCTVFIDSFRDRRTCYYFATNAIGAQQDGQRSGGTWDAAWDAVWFCKSSIDAQGYSIEMALPFYSLRFKQGEAVEMGILLHRYIPRNHEWGYWPSLDRGYDPGNLEMYAGVTGLRGIERGVNVQVKPYLLAGAQQTSRSTEREGEVGADMKWGITPNLTADLTVNTDFAQVESDALQISLDRFSLFYPEKRDFFTESNGMFSFGIPMEAEVFFSRRIGISGQSAVPILGGARLYGLVGDSNIGLMSIQTGEKGSVSGENFSVARLRQNILDRSYIGGIITSRSGFDAHEDLSAGLDFAHFLGPNSAVAGAVSRSGSGESESGNWFGTLNYYRFTDKFESQVTYTDIGPNFDPGIGFIRRKDQRTVSLYGAYKPRPGIWNMRQLIVSSQLDRTENHDGLCETLFIKNALMAFFQTNDQFGMPITYNEEYLPYDFEIVPGARIPAGKYEMWRSRMVFKSAPARRVSGAIAYDFGDYYGGSLNTLTGRLVLKLNPRFQFNLYHNYRWFNLPAKEFIQTNYSAEFSYYFSPRLTTRVVAQYEGYYKDLLMNVRLRWIYAPESEVWVVYDEGHRFGLPDPSLKDRTLLMKVVYNFNL